MSTTTQMISLTLIDPPAWDSRTARTGVRAKEDEREIAKMAAEFKDPRVGQLQPIVVEPKDGGRFERVFGGRRIKAAKLAGMSEIRAEVRPASTELDKMLANIGENMSREPLTTFETARAAAELQARGFNNKEIAERLVSNDGEKMSASHVSNLRAAYAGVPAPILKDWESEHPAATVQNLCTVARDGKDDEDKLKRWDALTQAAAKKAAGKVAAGGKASGRGQTGSGAGTGVSGKRLNFAVQALSTKAGSPELSDETRKWGKAILDFIMKGRKDIPGVGGMPVKVKTEKKGEKKGGKK